MNNEELVEKVASELSAQDGIMFKRSAPFPTVQENYRRRARAVTKIVGEACIGLADESTEQSNVWRGEKSKNSDADNIRFAAYAETSQSLADEIRHLTIKSLTQGKDT